MERRKAFFNNPYVLEFYRSGIRASARETEAVSGFEEPKEGIIPTTDPVFFEDEVTRTELKGYGDRDWETKQYVNGSIKYLKLNETDREWIKKKTNNDG